MFSILKFISLPVFIVSFLFGILFIYIWGEELHPVYIYPTPENVNDVLYKDKADNCFSYNYKEVACTPDAKSVDIQE